MKGQLELAMVEVQRAADYPSRSSCSRTCWRRTRSAPTRPRRRWRISSSASPRRTNERKDLTNALAEVEQQFRDANDGLDEERKGRQQLADELLGLKEALGNAQDRVTELAGRLTAAKEQYDALQAQASKFAEEAQAADLEVDRLKGDMDGSTLELQAEKQRARRPRRRSSAGERAGLGEVVPRPGAGPGHRARADGGRAAR